MKKAKMLVLGLSLALLLPGCSATSETVTATAETASAESTTAETHATTNGVDLTEGKYSDEKLDDSWDEEKSTQITFDGETITASEKGVTIEDNVATITQEGTYVLSGELTDGQLIVKTKEDGNVKLVFNGVTMTSGSSAPVYIQCGNVVITLAEGTKNTISDSETYVYADESEDEPKAAIFAKDDLTFNGTGSLTVNGNYNNAIQCKDDLKFITGTYKITSVNHAIVGKDSVSIKNGNFTIDAGGDAIRATNTEETDKGYVMIDNGSFDITSGEDGIQAETLLRVNDGTFDIVSGGGSANAAAKTEEMPGGQKGDQFGGRGAGQRQQEAPTDGTAPEAPTDGTAPEAPTDGTAPEAPTDGTAPEASTDGTAPEAPTDGTAPEAPTDGTAPEAPTDGTAPDQSEVSEAPTDGTASDETTTDSTADASTKGLKSYVDLVIAGGTFSIDSADDAVHSNKNVTIDSGSFTINTGDDGIHADEVLSINDGAIDIQKSYEGLEGLDIQVNGGDISIVASDDGVNAAGGSGTGGNPENQGATLSVTDGTLYVNASGDGLDANGSITISGGTVTVQGPTNGGNGSLDYDEKCQITGGTLLAAGSIGMAQSPSADSTQPVIIQSTNSTIEAGTTISVEDSSGNVVAEMVTEKSAQWFAISSPQLKQGESYTVSVGDSKSQITLNTILNEI